jgi:hypothetical protein
MKNNFFETSLNDLAKSTVNAFPKTTKRQHATDIIKIKEIFWNPYTGFKTLFVRGIAQNTENFKEYSPMVLFKNVKYHKSKSNSVIELQANDGGVYLLERINPDEDIQVRCDCKDFNWRFNYTNHLDGSLYGRKRKKYEALYYPDTANPLQMPGMCKHLIKLLKVINASGLI